MTENQDIDMVPVVSSNVSAIGYDRDRNVLAVRFHGGATYHYRNVPENVYQNMIEAESVGRFLAHQIKGKYEYEKVGG